MDLQLRAMNCCNRGHIPMAGWWVVICAFCSCAGWGLSAVHQLNARGYAVALGIGMAGLMFWKWRSGRAGKNFKLQTSNSIRLRQSTTARQGETPNSKLQKENWEAQASSPQPSPPKEEREKSPQVHWSPDVVSYNWRRLKKRFGRAFPLGFAIVAGLAILGGILHPPSNYDGLAYRTPRVLHWLAEGQWHWIHTHFQRLNTRASAFEWMTAPMFALARTDRFEFVVNSISFLLLPGLIFGVFRRLGVASKVAWHWMWLLPSGYCYLLQEGSIANDLFGAVFPLAALFFALRASETQKEGDAWLSVLAAALMTASKTSNLPLLLPWAVALLPSLMLLRRKIIGTVAIGVVAACCSFLPTAILNSLHGAG